MTQQPLPFYDVIDRWTPTDLKFQLLDAKEKRLILDLLFNKVECVATSAPDCNDDYMFILYHSVFFAENTPRETAERVCKHIQEKYNLQTTLSDKELLYTDPLIGSTPDFVTTYTAYEMKIYNKVVS